jgi:hypothetical protein
MTEEELNNYGMRVHRDWHEEHAARVDYIRKRARKSYLKAKAKKAARLKSLNLQASDISADVLAAIELDCRRYREARIAAALRRIGEAKLIG